MVILSDQELLAAWDAAQSVQAAMRPALLLRMLAGDDAPELLPIGRRDRRLLQLRESWRGGRFETVASCPACGTKLESAFETPPPGEASGSNVVDAGGVSLELRLPDSRDLAAIAQCPSLDDARANLAQRCIVRARRGGDEIAVPALDEEAIALVAAAMAALDPDGDLRFALICPECEHAWEMLFDPGTVLWSEIEAAAIGTMREVDALAAAYGWTEQQILSIPPVRRRIYLGMVLS